MKLSDNVHEHLSNLFDIVRRDYKSNMKISSLNGRVSTVWFLEQLIHVFPDRSTQIESIIDEILDDLLIQLQNNECNSNYIDGIYGFGHGISYYLQYKKELALENTLLDDLDTLVISSIRDQLRHKNYDFFYGALGGVQYLIQRLTVKPILSKNLEVIIDDLLEISDYSEEFGIYWQHESEIEGSIIDLSLSHGQASILVILAKLLELNIAHKKLKPLVQRISIQILDLEQNGRIPDSIVNKRYEYDNLKWCHGELGIVSSLAFSAQILNDSKIMHRVNGIAKNVARFNRTDNSHLGSATICHGTLGVAHIFNKWYNDYWQDEEILKAAKFWYNKSSEILESNVGYGKSGTELDEDTGVLTGVEGIGLALISFYKTNNFDWDRSILLY